MTPARWTWCPVCAREISVSKKGTIAHHGTPDNTCPGSGSRVKKGDSK